jgi:hypothetical protein
MYYSNYLSDLQICAVEINEIEFAFLIVECDNSVAHSDFFKVSFLHFQRQRQEDGQGVWMPILAAIQNTRNLHQLSDI